jgi:hypothetical protein
MAVCCQNLPLGALSNLSAPSLLIGELFKKFGLFFEEVYFTIYIVTPFATMHIQRNAKATNAALDKTSLYVSDF